jgi:hypothetical protein
VIFTPVEITIEYAALAAFDALAASATVIVTALVPLVVGVPLIAPVEAVSDSPEGSKPDVIDQTYAPEPPLA